MEIVAVRFRRAWQTWKNLQSSPSDIKSICKTDLTLVFVKWLNDFTTKSQVGCHRSMYKARYSFNFLQLQDAVYIPAPQHNGRKVILADWMACHYLGELDLPRLQKI